MKCVLGEVWIQSDHKKPPQWTKAAKAISLFCRSRRVVTEGLFCIYVFISVFRILGYTSCRTGTLGSGIRVEINVCGSTTEDDFFVQPNEQLLGRTTPWLICVSFTAVKSCCQHFLVPFLFCELSRTDCSKMSSLCSVVFLGMQLKMLFAAKWSTEAVKGHPVMGERKRGNGRQFFFSLLPVSLNDSSVLVDWNEFIS